MGDRVFWSVLKSLADLPTRRGEALDGSGTFLEESDTSNEIQALARERTAEKFWATWHIERPRTARSQGRVSSFRDAAGSLHHSTPPRLPATRGEQSPDKEDVEILLPLALVTEQLWVPSLPILGGRSTLCSVGSSWFVFLVPCATAVSASHDYHLLVEMLA